MNVPTIDIQQTGANIKALRKAAGIKVKDVADTLGVFTEDYTKPKDPDLVCRHLTIENGIIDFTKGEYFHCYEGLA